ncbi:type III pantothenate kinase [Acetobacteraceae bacterium]|nr:type III pantothenate kinase [Acetobacteraceae bacterium]
MRSSKILAVDMGNTNTVFALYDGQKWSRKWRLGTDSRRMADEYEVYLSVWFKNEGISFSEIENVAVSSVVPDALKELVHFLTVRFPNSPLVAKSSLAWGNEVLLPSPETLGADRRLNALAAVEFFPKVAKKRPIIIVDFGTATTFDVVNIDGNYIGGVIAPGINLASRALHDAAALLPRVAIEKPKKVCGEDTVEAMQSGLFFGYASLVTGILERLINELKVKPFVISTGGLGKTLSSEIIFDAHAPDLTLDGLRVLASRNIQSFQL